ncbi:MAG TPA: PAS domain S-box protein [Methylibium sp.]|nr:PAS domain S-box protein [Methylibium sp.]
MKPAPLPDDEAQRLHLLHELRILDTGSDPALVALARLVCSYTGWPIGGISLVDAARQWFPAMEGLPGVHETPRDIAFCAYTILGDGPLEVPDATIDRRFADNPLVTGAPGLRAYAAMPVVVDGLRIGTVCAMDRRPHPLSEAGRAALADLALLAGHLLEARLRAERNRLQEARVRGASRAGSDWLWESDAEGVLTWLSDSVEAHTGIPAREQIGRSTEDLNRPPGDEHMASRDAYVEARARRAPFRDLIAERGTTRGPIVVSISGDPVFDRQGLFKGYRGAARNVTPELAGRAAARRSEALLQHAIEHLNAGVMISGPEGRILLSNTQWRRAIERALPAVPTHWPDLVDALLRAGAYPDAVGREPEFARWRLSLAGPDAPAQELRMGHQHLLVTDQPLPDGSVVHLSMDITQRRRAEQSIAAQDARLRAVLAALPDLWFIADRDGTYLECSDALHPWLVQSFDELRGRRFVEVLPPDAAARSVRGVRAALAGEGVQRTEYRVRCRDGIERDFEARIAPMAADRALFLLRDLTELKRLERDMQLLQHVIEAEAALPMVVADASEPDLPLIFANAAFERLTGYSRAEVLGRNCRFLQGDEDNAAARRQLRTAVAEGRDCTVTLLNRRRDGSRFVNELHVAPVRDELGRLTHYIGVQYDVTERTRAAQQLELSEALYRSVASAVSDGLLVLDTDGVIVAANPPACTLLKLEAGQLQGQRITRLGFALMQEDGAPLPKEEHPAYETLRFGRSRLDRRVRLRRSDGVELLLRLSAQPLRPGTAGAPSACVITFRDVTAERAAEVALAAAEARWQFALDGAGEGVWDLDEDRGRVYYSARWKAMLGHVDDEVGDRLTEWTQRIHPDDKPQVMAAVARYRAGETPEYRTEHRLRHKDGRWIWVLDRGKTVERRADGSSRRVVGTHTDITHQREAERALREQQAAELASRAKSEFLSRMSHEMRTPLNAVLGFGQLLAQRGADDPLLLQRYAGHILHASRHLLALVDDVLDLQQVEEGRLLLTPQPLALHAAVAAALALVGPQAQARRLRVEAAVDRAVRVRADAKRLHQVLLNILSNGVKYNREGGTLRCALADGGDPGRVRLLVEDSGPGLSEAQVRRLFQPFERLGFETSAIEGTGLGLIIARRLMQEMGGGLELVSQPGRGTCVTLLLPRAGADMPAAAAEAAPTAAAAREPAGVPMRLLYVEDNPLNALLFAEAIGSRQGVELRLAGDGHEALAQVDGWQPDVLVLDARLPGLSGYDLLLRLRERPELAATPAFMCSADAMPEDLQRAAAAGFVGYWTKPIDIERVMHDLAALQAPSPA